MDDRYERMTAVDDGDHRTTARRDRDRVMFTVAVQRLAGVTQVASPLEGFALHNRLTHTLEMAQLGRRLAEKIIDENAAPVLKTLGGIDPDIVETACLAHDTGHPPFGHAAEAELDSLLRSAGLSEGFEGNAQSLRVVTKLEPYRPSFLGLNLTRASILALLKYPWTRADTPPGESKWGVYESDADILKWARRSPDKTAPRSSEADIMDIADDIAYSVHDLHDFFRCRLIPLEQLWRGTAEFDWFWTHAFREWKEPPSIFYEGATPRLRLTFLRLLRVYLNIEQPYTGTRYQRATLRRMTSDLIKRFRDGVQITKTRTGPRITLAPARAIEIRLLREVTHRYVHRLSALVAQQVGHRLVISNLFSLFRDHAERGSVDILPVQFREIFEDERSMISVCGESEGKPHLRIISDALCSLTDQQALELFRRVTGITPAFLGDGTTS